MSYALFDLLIEDASFVEEVIVFSNGREYTLGEIYTNLLLSLDIGYRSFMGELTAQDTNNILYDISIELYSNPVQLPSNSGLYGMKLSQGSNVQISNTKIQDLQLNTLEIPATSFVNCIEDEQSDEILKDPFGKVVDVRGMLGSVENAVAIELGDIAYNPALSSNSDIIYNPPRIVQENTGFIYVGNPVSDAYIALSKYRQQFGQTQTNRAFYGWALNGYDDISYDGLPSCVSFSCNNDINDDENRGIIGIDMEQLTAVTIENIVIKRLFNKSPLSSYACGNYTAATKGSDTKGMNPSIHMFLSSYFTIKPKFATISNSLHIQ